MALGRALRAAVRMVRADRRRVGGRAVRVGEPARVGRDGVARCAGGGCRARPHRTTDAAQSRAGADPLDRRVGRDPGPRTHRRRAAGGRLRHRLHGRGAAARARTRPGAGIGHAHLDDLERASGDVRAHDPRSGVGRAGRARQGMDGRGRDDARDLAARHRPHRLARRGVPGGFARLHRSARRHRPLARRPRARLPGRRFGRRHDRDGARRCQSDVQGVCALAGAVDDRRRPHHRDRGRWARRPAVRELPRLVRRAGGVRDEPCRLGDEPSRPLGRTLALRQVGHERHRAAGVRRQLPVLVWCQRGGRPVTSAAVTSICRCVTAPSPSTTARWWSTATSSPTCHPDLSLGVRPRMQGRLVQGAATR